MKVFITIFTAVLIASISISAAKKKDKNTYHRFSEICMGTKFTILIDHSNAKLSQEIANQAFKEAHRLNNVLSDYESESELTKLSNKAGSGFYIPLSKDLYDVLEYSHQLSKETNGKFDITIGPLSRLWRIARFRGILPENDKLINAHQRVGFKNILLKKSEQKAKLVKKGMVLDLGGIAKGYTADRMLKIFSSNNVTRVLIDAGGDLLLGDPPLEQRGWTIEIGGRKHPDLPILKLSNMAIATSGDLEQKVTIKGKTYSHIIDPTTGLGLTSMSQVTILAKTAMEADSLASAILLLGKEKGGELIQNRSNIKGFFIEKDNLGTKLTKLE